MIIQNPPAIPDQIWKLHGWWNLWLLAAPVAWQIPREMNSLVNAKRATAPVVILIAGSDRVISPRFQWKVANAYAGEKRLIVQANAGHDTHLNKSDDSKLQAGMSWPFDRAIHATATRPASTE